MLQLATALLLLLWLAALGTTIRNVLVLPRLRPDSGEEPRPRASGPFVSIIVPARDEERAIERTVRALLAQTYQPLEVIVVNDRSTDRTGEILRAIGDPRLVVVDGEDPPAGWLGKPWALAQGSRRAGGELLLFVDADIHYTPDAVAVAVAAQQRSGASLLALLPHFELHGFWENVAMPQLPMVAFSFMPLWLTNRTTIPILAIGGGPGNLVVRADYDAVGGHEALRNEVVDDVGLARLLRSSGRRTEAALANDLISLRMYHGLREIVDGFTKNAFATMGRSYPVALTAVALLLGGHFLPYALLFVPSVRMLAIATVTTITLVRVILFRALRFRLDTALFLHPLQALVWAWIFLRSTWTTGVRNEVRWRGRTYPR